MVADPHSGKQNRGSKLSGDFYNGTNPIHAGSTFMTSQRPHLLISSQWGIKFQCINFWKILTILKVYKKENNIKTKGSCKELSRSELEWEGLSERQVFEPMCRENDLPSEVGEV